MITTIGEQYYCALAKGPLVQDHMLIVPVEHSPNTLSLPSECEKELSRYQSSLKAYFKSQGKEVVFFEWVSKKATHANLQVEKLYSFLLLVVLMVASSCLLSLVCYPL